MAKSGPKGKAGERKVVELLKVWWKSEEFARNWIGQSGAIGTILEHQKSTMPAHVMQAMTGDIITPLEFPFSVESKNYSEVDLYEIVRNEKALVRQWWEQVAGDSKRVKKWPLLLFKEDRKQYYVLFGSEVMYYVNKHKLNVPVLAFQHKDDPVYLATWDSFSSNITKSMLLEAKE